MPDAIFSIADFQTGVLLQDYALLLPSDQPDFPQLLAECEPPPDAVERVRASGVRFAAVVTEPWCLDSLHALPILLRLQQAAPAIEVRIWRRSDDPDLALRIAGEPPGGIPPSVPHVAFFDANFGGLGHFRERPQSLTTWLEDQSRHFRTRLRMQERARVRAETLAGLLEAAEERSTTRSTAGRPLTVFEFWEARDPADAGVVEEILHRHLPALNAVEGMLSVDFSAVKTQPGRYLALFRYSHEGVRPAFLTSDAVQRLRAEVDPLWTRVTDSTWSYQV